MAATPTPSGVVTRSGRRFFRLGIRGRLIALVLLILVPLLLLQAVQLRARFTEQIQSVLQSDQEFARAIDAAFMTYLDGLWDAEAAMGAAIVSAPKGMSHAQIESLLNAELPHHPTLRGLLWLAPDGTAMAGTRPGIGGTSLAAHEFVAQIRQGANQVVSDLMEMPGTGELSVVVARAIRRNGTLLGMVVAGVDVRRLGAALPVQREGASSFGLGDRQGRAVFNHNSDLPLERRELSLDGPARKALLTQRPARSSRFRANSDGKIRMGAAVPIAPIGWVAFASSSVDEVLGAAWDQTWRSLAVLVLVVAGSVVGAVLLTNRLLRSILALQRAAQALSEGDWSARVGLPGFDELSEATQTFDRMADRILQLEREMDRLFHLSADLLAITGRDGVRKRINPAWERVLGFSTEELMTRPLVELLHPDDRQRTVEEIDKAAYGTWVAVENRLRCRDGSYRWVLWSIVAWQDAVYSVGHDITDRKQMEQALRDSEERFRAVAETASDAIITLDEQGAILFANRAAGEMFGYGADELVGGPVAALLPAPPTLTEPAAAARDVALEQSLWWLEAAELSGRRRCGRMIPLEASFAEYRHNHARVRTVILRDVSERKRVETILRARARQQEAVAALGQSALAGLAPSTLVDIAVDQVREALGVSFAAVLELLPDGKSLTLRALAGAEMPAALTVGVETDSQSGYTLMTGAPIIVEDMNTETRFKRIPTLNGCTVTSSASVIVQGRDRPYGVLAALSDQRRSFGSDDTFFLQAVANMLATAMERHKVERMQVAQYAVASILAESSSVRDAAPKILQALCEHLDWDVGAIWLLDRQAGALRCSSLWHRPHLEIPRFVGKTREMVLTRGSGFPGMVWDCGEPIWLMDAIGAPDFPRMAVAAQEGLHAALGFPIRVGGEISSVLELFSGTVRPDDGELRATMMTICSLIGQFMERVRTADALRESNEKLQTLVRSAPIGIVAVDHHGRIREWNEAAQQTLGWSEQEVLGHPIVPVDGRGQYQELWELLARGETVIGHVLRWQRRDGRPIDLSLSAAPLHDAEGRVCGAMAIFSDITERTRLLQIVAHELRNPMAGIKGIIALVRRRMDAGRPADLRLLGVMEEEVNRLSALLNEILEAFRVQAGRLTLEEEEVVLEEVVHSALQPFAAAAEQHQFHVEVLHEGPIWVWGDVRRLEEVFRNLFSNAVKYSPRGGEVRVTLRVSEGWARVSVTDVGVGIPRHLLSRVFEEFFRAHNLGTQDPGGLGLGLYICHDIVVRHGGRIWVESDEGHGATFHVQLPLHRAGMEPSAQPAHQAR